MRTHCRQIGLSLVEILVALAVSLLLLAGVTQIFLGTRQSFRLNENVAQVQESGQFAIEQMSRTIRMAGATGCPNTDQVANTINPTSGADATERENWWWTNLSSTFIRGFDEGDANFLAKTIGTEFSQRTGNSDAIYVISGSANDLSVSKHEPSSAVIHTTSPNNFQPGEIAVICDSYITSIFQVTGPKQSVEHVNHATGANVSPGNCSGGLGYPTDCSSNKGKEHKYGGDALISRYVPTAYYIGNGSNGRPALFTRSLENGGATVELVQNVENMQLTYTDNTNSGITASAVGNWSQVRAVRVELLVSGSDTGVTAQQDAALSFAGATVSNTDKSLRQVFSSTVGIRNRLP